MIHRDDATGRVEPSCRTAVAMRVLYVSSCHRAANLCSATCALALLSRRNPPLCSALTGVLLAFFVSPRSLFMFLFFFNDTATTEIYTLSLHDALPISSNLFLSLILHLGNLFLIVQLHFSKLFLILKSGVNHTSRGSISTSTLPSIKLRKCSSKIITSILSFISGRLATKSNQIKQLI